MMTMIYLETTLGIKLGFDDWRSCPGKCVAGEAVASYEFACNPPGNQHEGRSLLLDRLRQEASVTSFAKIAGKNM